MSSSSSDETYDETSSSSSHRKRTANSSDEVASSSTSGLGDCVVCGRPAHGVHFGVLACRACAAFYRRTVVLNKQYACRRGKKACAINREERHICRYCRWCKCISVGMQADNVQWDRAKERAEQISAHNAAEMLGQEPPPLRTDEQHSEGRNTEEEAKDAQQEFFPVIRFLKKPDADPNSPAGLAHPSNAANLMPDFRSVIDRVDSIFQKPPQIPNSGIRMTLIQRMIFGLQHLRRNQNMKPEVVSYLSASECKTAWERQLFAMAEFAMYCEEFSQLPREQKLAVYKGSSRPFWRLERFQVTASIFGRSMMENGLEQRMVIVLNDELAVDFISTVFDFSLLTDYNQYDIKRMHKPLSERLYNDVARPMIGLHVTDTELAFMLGQLMWHVEGKAGISPETRAVSESFRARISNELHDYYFYELKMSNYASRLMQLMGIVTDVENIMDQRTKMLELARILDVFKIDMQDTDTNSHSSCTELKDATL